MCKYIRVYINNKLKKQLFLYVDNVNRQQILETRPEIFKTLFPEDEIMGILDGTYLFCEKSIDHKQQKLTWSSQKNDNLVKAKPIQLPSGQWFDSAVHFIQQVYTYIYFNLLIS